ncbi:hypothetical protein H257_15050 [Aphanomyces astaci]|uniref:Uncharacterized protein n=1 Tax=Aphanomyces astaci TaxID=112090 RepID=W4FQK1_APHAT|nr:hypothetical protein H257_15050 [Aphanomyces astaci]ETV69231.1 hypothetical protein H257_15050 [Aphanomyces astaci]|eukprot:XP_009841333.1 hypothetical protein H257_15050 [Aphanomyces astaci]
MWGFGWSRVVSCFVDVVSRPGECFNDVIDLWAAIGPVDGWWLSVASLVGAGPLAGDDAVVVAVGLSMEREGDGTEVDTRGGGGRRMESAAVEEPGGPAAGLVGVDGGVLCTASMGVVVAVGSGPTGFAIVHGRFVGPST